MASVKRQGNEEVLTEDALDDLKVLVRIVGLAQCLLSCRFIHAGVHRVLGHAWAVQPRCSKLATWSCHRAPVVDALLLLFCAFLEEYFAKYVFLLLVRVIVLDIVVVWLIKHAI